MIEIDQGHRHHAACRGRGLYPIVGLVHAGTIRQSGKRVAGRILACRRARQHAVDGGRQPGDVERLLDERRSAEGEALVADLGATADRQDDSKHL